MQGAPAEGDHGKTAPLADVSDRAPGDRLGSDTALPHAHGAGSAADTVSPRREIPPARSGRVVMDLEQSLRRLIREEVRAAVREELHPPLLSPAQAGQLVDRSAKTILNWLREGKLQRQGPGPRPLVSRAELLALAEAPRKARTSARAGGKAPSAEAEVHRLMRRHG